MVGPLVWLWVEIGFVAKLNEQVFNWATADRQGTSKKVKAHEANGEGCTEGDLYGQDEECTVEVGYPILVILLLPVQ